MQAERERQTERRWAGRDKKRGIRRRRGEAKVTVDNEKKEKGNRKIGKKGIGRLQNGEGPGMKSVVTNKRAEQGTRERAERQNGELFLPTSLVQTQRAKDHEHTRRATMQVNNLTTACTPGGRGRRERVTVEEEGQEKGGPERYKALS